MKPHKITILTSFADKGKIKTSRRQIFANLLKNSKLAKINPCEYLIWRKLISKVYLRKIVIRKENVCGYFD